VGETADVADTVGEVDVTGPADAVLRDSASEGVACGVGLAPTTSPEDVTDSEELICVVETGVVTLFSIAAVDVGAGQTTLVVSMLFV
jgi:hypothetical protein